MKVCIFGAGGIIGQHLALCVPGNVEPLFFRRHSDPFFLGADLNDTVALLEVLNHHKPDVIVNLAGESSTDEVEREPQKYSWVNSSVPAQLVHWCDENGAHYVHISTQAVFSGDDPPYKPEDETHPVNEYGKQKELAETLVKSGGNWTIIRPTFVLGVRPIPAIGRRNPVEQMLEGQKEQTCDRWFTTLYARDAAEFIWASVNSTDDLRASNALSVPSIPIHFSSSTRVSRYDIAKDLGTDAEPVPHDNFPVLAPAPRPVDTSYDETTSLFNNTYKGTISNCLKDYVSRESLDVRQRAKEIALFLRKTERECLEKLQQGFGVLHAAVRDDFNISLHPTGNQFSSLVRVFSDPDRRLLQWYRSTESYIWELSAYHCDPGFNYSGMCKGIVDRLKTENCSRVLCLGDGIGDLSMALSKIMPAYYNDLSESRTAAFAKFRFWMYGVGNVISDHQSDGWEPPDLWSNHFGAIASLDFLEHVTDVESWVREIYKCLKPGGLFCAQNAFNMGSGPQGSIPMHLSRNDHWEKDWDPFLASLGFLQESSNWYRKPNFIR